MNEDYHFLNDTEKSKLISLAQDEVLKSAVKKILLAGVYYNGILEAGHKPDTGKNFTIQTALFAIQNNPKITDEDLGRELRMSVGAMRLIDLGFQEIEKFNPIDKKPKKDNPGR